jgi:hypothetical protein
LISRPPQGLGRAPQGALSIRTACGDVVIVDGDALTIRAASPIEGLVRGGYRPTILLFRGERFVLEDQDGLVYVLRRAVEGGNNSYVVDGVVVAYDEERHLERRREVARTALAWIIWLPMVPLMPLLGLLPEAAKRKLVHVGLDADRATRMSIALEWLLLVPLVIAYPFLGGFFTLPGALDGALTLLVALDIAYRVTADADQQTPGLFGVVGDLRRFVVEMVRAARRRDDDDPPGPPAP